MFSNRDHVPRLLIRTGHSLYRHRRDDCILLTNTSLKRAASGKLLSPVSCFSLRCRSEHQSAKHQAISRLSPVIKPRKNYGLLERDAPMPPKPVQRIGTGQINEWRDPDFSASPCPAASLSASCSVWGKVFPSRSRPADSTNGRLARAVALIAGAANGSTRRLTIMRSTRPKTFLPRCLALTRVQKVTFGRFLRLADLSCSSLHPGGRRTNITSWRLS